MRSVLTLCAWGMLALAVACGSSSEGPAAGEPEPSGAEPGGAEPSGTDPQGPARDVTPCSTDADCGAGMRCDSCATSSCDTCEDCLAGCVPAS